MNVERKRLLWIEIERELPYGGENLRATKCYLLGTMIYGSEMQTNEINSGLVCYHGCC